MVWRFNPSLVPLGRAEPVDYVLLSFGPEGWKYSAAGPREFAAKVRTTLRAGYFPVAIRSDMVLLEHWPLAEPTDDPRLSRLDAMLALLDAGHAVPRGAE